MYLYNCIAIGQKLWPVATGKKVRTDKQKNKVVDAQPKPEVQSL
jgi:hypothetical protein